MFLAVLLLLLASQEGPQAPTVVTTLVADFNGNGQPDELQIVMTSGRRYVDRALWCGMSYNDAPKYEGTYVARVSLRSGQLIDTSLNEFLGSPIWFFNTDWKIHAFQLPHSRALAFTLGQYGFCRSWGYRVFRVESNGSVIPLTPKLYNGDAANSTTEIYPTAGGFQITEVSGTDGAPTVCAQWVWNSSQAALVRRGERPGSCEEPPAEPDDAP